MQQPSMSHDFCPTAQPHLRGAMVTVSPAATTQITAEALAPMELAAAYGFERHRRITSCGLPQS
jgi:hypothetical protein